MPYRKQQFGNNEIYHITLKGIDDNLIFKDIDDYYRGIFSIYEFNDLNPVNIQRRREIRSSFKKKIRRDRVSTDFVDNRDKLVEILCFCFMPNHIHLLVKQVRDGGISRFMAKLGIGYAGYFNRKYQRKGYLFQNRFDAVKIKTEEQLKIVLVYIHTNPISLIYPEWKEIKVQNFNKIIKFLENYKWFSHLDCIGIKNFPSVTQRDFMLDLFGSIAGYQEFIKDYISWKGEPKEYSELFLE